MIAAVPDSEDIYLVWSHEHSRWWGPGFNGYTPSMSEAGRYTRAQALDICIRAIPGHATLPELPVRLADVELMRDRYNTEYSVRLGQWQ